MNRSDVDAPGGWASGRQAGGTGPALLLHGGAWAIPDAECADHLEGLREALDVGRALLGQGMSAVDVAEAVVAALERHGAFDAGRGAVLTREGTVELDAGIMCGERLGFGAVAGVRRVASPIQVARRILERGAGDFRLLAGDGAEVFARAEGFDLVDNATLISARERDRHAALTAEAVYRTSHPFRASVDTPRGTVGCVVRDARGGLAAATSTGGTPLRPSGRIGDTPLPGSGFYATGRAAASATGWGEAIATMLVCGRVVDAVEGGVPPERAAASVLRRMHAGVRDADGVGARGGVIAIDAAGEGGWAFTTPRMARGGWSHGLEAWTAIDP